MDPDSEENEDFSPEEESNPYVPNSSSNDFEEEQYHKKKWDKYITKKAKMMEKGYKILICPARSVKVKVGDEVKWVSLLKFNCFTLNICILTYTIFSFFCSNKGQGSKCKKEKI